ncbi:MAG: carbohydrate ABC transporter substrate-binding protein [Spirochaetales bacterium]|nr:carbohydrate ABC transporter substrate-binding protein [Spirochaetales bacterium]
MKRIITSLICLLMFASFAFATGQGDGTSAAKGGEVEVLHWWTSGGEAAAVAVLKQLLEAEGYTWKDFAVAGGGGDNAMTVLKSRALAGNPPAAAQVKGPQIQLWGDEGVLTNLNDVAKAEDWDNLLPKVVADVMKYKGNYVAVPVNVHRINWMWCNPAVFKKAGATIPKTWEEFEAAAKKIKAAGLIPVAWGGQPWQEATVFEIIVAGVGGTDFYKKALVDADVNTLKSATMVKVFKTLRMVLQYIDPGAPNRDWNLATSMVINGEAGMQFMGDWAKGEFTAAKKAPDKDYIAATAPQTSKQFIFNIDSFIMFNVADKDKNAQKAMARLIVQPKFQEVFNINKGSIPVRLGMSEEPFDIPARLAMKDFVATSKSGDLVPSMAHEMAVMPDIKGAMVDTVTNFCNSDMSAEDAAAQLASAVAAVK